MSELRSVISCLKSIVATSGRTGLPLKDFVAEYLVLEEEEVPFRKFGYHDLDSFLTEKVGMEVRNNCVYYESENSKHISNLIQGQKTKPKLATGGLSIRRSMPAPRPAPVQAYPSWSAAQTPLKFSSQQELEQYCSRVFPRPFRHELHLKLKACPADVTPSDFIKFFNQSNLEKYKFSRDLDFKGLQMIDFFHGLPDVFVVETRDGVTRLNPAEKKSPSFYETKPTPMVSSSPSPAVTVAPVESFPAIKSLPTVNDMVKLFKQVNEIFAGGEVSMLDYLRKVSEVGGPNAHLWLKRREFNMESFFTFVHDNSSGFSIREVPGKDAILISDSSSSSSNGSSSVVARNLNRLDVNRKPSTWTTFKVRKLDCCDKVIDILINDFDSVDLTFSFTPDDRMGDRRQLMRRLRDEYVKSPEGQLLPSMVVAGMPCVAPFESNVDTLYRVLVLSVRADVARVHFVDFGMKVDVEIKKLRVIEKPFMNEDVCAYLGRIVNVYPTDGKDTFSLKAIQEIKLELEDQMMKATVVRFCEEDQRYHLDLREAMAALREKKVVTFDRPLKRNVPESNDASPINGVSKAGDLEETSFQHRVLPNCETIVEIRRGNVCYLSSNDISRMLGLKEDTFIADLSKFNVSVIGSWTPSSSLLGKLQTEDGRVPSGDQETLIPMKAAAPLMRSHIFVCRSALANEKNVLKALMKLADSV